MSEKGLPQSKSGEGSISRNELFDLLRHYESVIKDELDFFFKYMNFYIGILSALLAGTLTGLISVKLPSKLDLILLLGPGLILFFSYLGYRNVKVYYRRYNEAWLTSINIKAMLGLNKNVNISNDLFPPTYPSQYGGGFITQFKRPKIQNIFEKMEEEGVSSEKVLEKLLKAGDTLKFARNTFWVFRISAAILAITIIKHCW